MARAPPSPEPRAAREPSGGINTDPVANDNQQKKRRDDQDGERLASQPTERCVSIRPGHGAADDLLRLLEERRQLSDQEDCPHEKQDSTRPQHESVTRIPREERHPAP